MVQRKELGKTKHYLGEPETVLALRRLHEAQGMRTIWDSQMGQRIIVDRDENGDLERIMVHEQDGERGTVIEPAWWWCNACCKQLEPYDILDNMGQGHPLRVEYNRCGYARDMWLPWVFDLLDGGDAPRTPQICFSDAMGGYTKVRGIGPVAADIEPPEQEDMSDPETVLQRR